MGKHTLTAFRFQMEFRLQAIWKLFAKNMHPFERLGSSIQKYLHHTVQCLNGLIVCLVKTLIRSNDLITHLVKTLIHLNDLATRLEKTPKYVFERLGHLFGKHIHPFELLGHSFRNTHPFERLSKTTQRMNLKQPSLFSQLLRSPKMHRQISWYFG